MTEPSAQPVVECCAILLNHFIDCYVSGSVSIAVFRG
jgi:hypothetical protein